jgi:hypothetical protein
MILICLDIMQGSPIFFRMVMTVISEYFTLQYLHADIWYLSKRRVLFTEQNLYGSFQNYLSMFCNMKC